MPGTAALIVAAASSAAVSAALTRGVLAYALRRGLLDSPGQRRSHAVATPRGGGLGAVLATLLALAWLAQAGELDWAAASLLGVAVAAVAAVGWWDDHRPQPVSRRLLVHLIAALAVAWALRDQPLLPTMGWILLATLAGMVLINFWNFMDGIDGLAASQASICACAIAVALLWAGDPGWAALSLLFGAAVAGFLPFNLPRARIFLGDVGSGCLGLVLAALLLRAAAAGALDVLSGLVLISAFAVDAGATLAARIFAGKRFTRPHREHLYQWWVRRGRSHVRISAYYALWTLAAIAWLACWHAAALPWRAAAQAAWLVAALALWSALRNRLLIEARGRG